MKRNIISFLGILFAIFSTQNALSQGRVYWVQPTLRDYGRPEINFYMVIDTPDDIFSVPEGKNDTIKSFLEGGRSKKFNKNRMSFVVFLDNEMYLVDEDGNVFHESNITKVNIEEFEDLLSAIIPSEKRRNKSVGDINSFLWKDLKKP